MRVKNTSMTGEFNLSTTINRIGFTGRVALHVFTNSNPGSLEINFDKADKEQLEQWRNSIELGIRYFFSVYKKPKNHGYKVEVIFINSIMINTTEIVMVYVAAKAMCNALQVNMEDLKINEKGVICFPK